VRKKYQGEASQKREESAQSIGKDGGFFFWVVGPNEATKEGPTTHPPETIGQYSTKLKERAAEVLIEQWPDIETQNWKGRGKIEEDCRSLHPD